MFYEDLGVELSFEISKEKIEEIKNLEQFPLCPRGKNLTGLVFQHLTVLKRGPSQKGSTGKVQGCWWCICDCPEHKVILVRGNNLQSGNTKSCGCHNKAMQKLNFKKAVEACKLNLTNKRFGLLVAIAPTEKRSGNSVVWQCQCDCGATCYIPANTLNAGRTESCGCSVESKGVRKIRNILLENNVPYSVEKTFPTCIFPETQAHAKFDFYINNEFLLEYDGKQHFYECDTNFFRDSFEKRQQHDLFKNQWCKENNIPLKRIPYTEIKNITFETIMGDEFLV